MRRLCALVAVAVAAISMPVAAQTCTATNVANCTVAGDGTTRNITIGVGYVARLLLSSSSVTLPTPNGTNFDNLYTGTSSVGVIVRANTGWQVMIRSSANLWTGTDISQARQDKPAGDLEWSLSSGSGFVAMTTSLAQVQTGSATAGSSFTIYLRSKLAWNLDRAGSYQLPLEVTITSP